jgi:hypothetical protein
LDSWRELGSAERRPAVDPRSLKKLANPGSTLYRELVSAGGPVEQQYGGSRFPIHATVLKQRWKRSSDMHDQFWTVSFQQHDSQIQSDEGRKKGLPDVNVFREG